MADNQYVNKVVLNGVTQVDLTGDTITPQTLMEGETAHDASGAPIVGTYVPSPDLTIVHKALTVSGNAATFSPADPRMYVSASISANLALTLRIGNTNEHYIFLTNSGTSKVTVAISGDKTIVGNTAIEIPVGGQCELSVIKDNNKYILTYFMFD